MDELLKIALIGGPVGVLGLAAAIYWLRWIAPRRRPRPRRPADTSLIQPRQDEWMVLPVRGRHARSTGRHETPFQAYTQSFEPRHAAAVAYIT